LGGVPRGVCHSFNTDHVEVAVEHQRPSTRFSNSRHDIRPAGQSVVQVDAKSPVGENAGQKFGDGTLSRSVLNEQWVP